MVSTYTHPQFVNRIDRQSIRTIVECGSRDCLDAIEMNNYYHPHIIYSFECNPESIEVCKSNLLPNIKLIEKAVCDKNGIVDFYPTDMDRSIDKNIGASSLLWHRDNKVEFFQKHIQVDAIRLDTFMEQERISKIDLLCMDLQGAEHLALEGLGKRIIDVRYIITEISFKSYYEGDILRIDMRRLLANKGFTFLQYISGNMLYKRYE